VPTTGREIEFRSRCLDDGRKSKSHFNIYLLSQLQLSAIQRGNAASIRDTFPDSAILSEIFVLYKNMLCNYVINIKFLPSLSAYFRCNLTKSGLVTVKV
jgi:hypothetical protein